MAAVEVVAAREGHPMAEQKGVPVAVEREVSVVTGPSIFSTIRQYSP